MGRHDFLNYMSFRMTCIMMAYVFREVILCCSKCLMGCHVLVSACFQDGISYNMLCFTERHVLLEVMFYLRVCNIGGHVLLLEMSYWGTCFTGRHILWDDLLHTGTPYMRKSLTGGYVL